MPEVPATEWHVVPFAEVAESISKRVDDPTSAGVERYVGLEHLDPDVLSVRRWGQPEDVAATKLLFDVGDVIYGRRRAYQRKLARADFAGICSAHALVLRARPDVLRPELLPFLMRTDYFHTRALAISVGSLSPTINWKTLAREPVLVPPYTDQWRFAELLWAAESAAECYRGVGAATMQARRSLITEHLRGAHELVPLRTVASFVNGSTFPHRFQGSKAGDYPHFKVADMNTPGNELYLREAENWITEAQRQEMGARVVPPGAVVFARVGAALAAERRRLVERPSVIDDNMMAAVPLGGLVPEYLHACLTGVRMTQRRNDGVVPSVNQSIVGAVELPAPEPAVQERLVARVREVETYATAVARRLQTTIALRDALTNSLLRPDVH